MVAPVVVHPDTDSKKASTKDKDSCLSSIKGIDPIMLRISQKSTTIKKPSLILISLLAEILGRYSKKPNPRIIRKE